MQTLRQGSRRSHVRFLQRLLNEHFARDRAVAPLDEDGVFGHQTDLVVRRAQTLARMPNGAPLTVDGIVGPDTWRAIGLTVEVLWPLPQIGQTTDMSCWNVAQGLATGRMTSAMPVNAEIAPNGGLYTRLPNMEAYAADCGMRLLPSMPSMPEGLLPHLRRGPIILTGDWLGGGQHTVVVSGYFQGQTPYSAMIQINNSLPIGLGSITVTDYPTMDIQGGGLITPQSLIVK